MSDINRVRIGRISVERGLDAVSLTNPPLVSVRDDMVAFDTPEEAERFAADLIAAAKRAREGF